MRFFVELSFKGAKYCGWQYQNNSLSIQQVLQEAFEVLFKNKIALVGAGRTDAGVNARKFIAHFDIEEKLYEEDVLTHKLNRILPEDIAINKIFQVHPEAHARFSAISRTYKYYIITKKSPFHIDMAHFCANVPDIDLMNICAKELLNYSDFTCFCKLHSSNKTNICKIMESYWIKEGEMLIYTITANRFLRNMVRSIVGALLLAGYKKINLQKFKNIIESKDRSIGSQSVPAKGLFLESVEYPEWVYNFN